MSRLIDADSYLKNFCNRFCSVKECTRTQKKDCCIAISLEEEPTAYDVDKVVERLEEYRDDFMDDIYEELREDADNCRANRIIDRFDEAIGIVKEERK